MSNTLLELKSVCKTYSLKKKPVKKAVHNVSFSLEEGELFSLLGVNGAGKTTLSGIMAGLHPPTSGELLWKGKSIYKDLIPYKRLVGLCPQKPNIDPDLTLEETLTFSGRCYGLSQKEAEKERDRLVDEFDLGSYRKSVAKHLSGGYKQRFLLARTLVHKPQFIILDEPTVGLDAHIRKQLWEVVKRLKGDGVTILLTTHYLEEAEALSDRVCFIEEGEIRVLDTPENLNKHYKQKNLEDVFLHLMEEGREKQ